MSSLFMEECLIIEFLEPGRLKDEYDILSALNLTKFKFMTLYRSKHTFLKVTFILIS